MSVCREEVQRWGIKRPPVFEDIETPRYLVSHFPHFLPIFFPFAFHFLLIFFPLFSPFLGFSASINGKWASGEMLKEEKEEEERVRRRK